MKQYTEEKVLQKLDIADFSGITVDKIPELSSLLKYMEPQLAKKALDQLPSFKSLASELVGQYKDTVDKMIIANGKSETEFYEACSTILLSLQEELKRDDLDAEDRERIEIKMIYIAELIGRKDSESKHFKLIMAITLGVLVAAFGGIAVAAIASGKRDKQGYDSFFDDSIDSGFYKITDNDFSDVTDADFGD